MTLAATLEMAVLKASDADVASEMPCERLALQFCISWYIEGCGSQLKLVPVTDDMAKIVQPGLRVPHRAFWSRTLNKR